MGLIHSSESERRSEVLRVIVRDGVWHAAEGRKAGTYRPYEAPFDLATAYFFLTRSEPRCIVRSEGVSLGTYEGTGGGAAVYRTPIAEPMRRTLLETAARQLRANLGHGRRTTVAGPPGSVAVYGKARRPCRRCGTPITWRRTGLQNRSTYWCPRCQPPLGAP